MAVPQWSQKRLPAGFSARQLAHCMLSNPTKKRTPW
jgi:hypothetical protein